jgi:hypothetical protein
MSAGKSTKRWVIDRYLPNQPVGASIPGTCIAGQNVIFESEGYSRVFRGAFDIGETHANAVLGYTAATTSGNSTVVCAGGALLTDCVPYQHILIGRELFLIQKITDNTHMVVSPTPSDTVSGLTITQVPNLHAIARQQPERASLYAGKIVRYREAALFAVGRGPLRINGADIAAPLTATSSPQVAYPNPGGTYDVRPVGFTRPPAPTVTAVAGGTKGMAARDYTFRVSKKRIGFPGYGLASLPVKATLATGQQFQITFAAFDASQGQTSAYLWVSRTDDVNGGDAWYLLGEYTTVGPTNIEWYNGELGDQYIDDNDPPPPSLFVVSANDHLIFASWGDAPDGSGNAQAPGPGIAVSKSNNPEAFPPQYYAFISPADEIVGVHVGKVGSRQQDAMVFFLSQNSLSVGRFTESAVSPLVVTTYAMAGFAHQYSGVVADDYFYGLSGGTAGTGIFRTSDGENIDRSFGQDVIPDLGGIKTGRSFVGHDPVNGWVVVIESNSVVGAGGKYQSKAWAFNTRTNKWNTPLTLGDGSTSDFTVCGLATVGSILYLITTDGKVYWWDNGGVAATGFIATPFDTLDGSQYDSIVRRVKVNGSINGTIKLYRNFDYANLVAGTGSAVPSYALTNPLYTPAHFNVWKPAYHVKSLAWRADFFLPGGFRLIDSVDMEIATRDGFAQ